MLVRFRVENFRSFNKEQIFSMAAGKHTRHSDHVYNAKGKRLLKSGLIYGANASGKTNLIKAIQFGRNIALKGINGRNLSNQYYRINNSNYSKPGIFQFDFFSNGKFFSYGFAISYDKEIILSEWLYQISDTSEKCIFERENGSIKTELKFSNKQNEDRFSIYSKDIKNCNTFLMEILNKDIDEIDFEDFYDVGVWFASLVFIFPQSKFNDFEYYNSSDTRNDLEKLLRHFDTGVEKVIGKEIRAEEGLSFLPNEVRNEILDEVNKVLSNDNEKTNSVGITISGKRFCFSKKNGEIVSTRMVMNHGNNIDFFELDDESDGTKRLFDLIPLYKKSEQPCVIFIDELDRSFHTKLTIEFFNMYFSAAFDKPSQMIVTLHDANVMDLELLRQDEIWFVERENHSTKMYSLNKFKERYDKDISKDYILGRYGAIPIFSESFGDTDE